jgi:hypothetical protein
MLLWISEASLVGRLNCRVWQADGGGECPSIWAEFSRSWSLLSVTDLRQFTPQIWTSWRGHDRCGLCHQAIRTSG